MSSGAMFTAVTGTNAQQKRIDVIAHNLANVGTVGFKRQQAQFEDLLYENVTGNADSLHFDGEANYRNTDVPDDDDQRESRLRLDRLSYALGGHRFAPQRFEIGRFLHYGMSEFGVVDGVEWNVRRDEGDRFGLSAGFLPEPDLDHDTGSDFEVSGYYRWVPDESEEFSLAGAYQKTFHDGDADRDLVVGKLVYFPRDSWSFHGTTWIDFYTEGDDDKPFVELTQAYLDSGRDWQNGASFHVTFSHLAFPQMDRDEFLPVTDDQLADDHSERLALDGRVQMTRDTGLSTGVGPGSRAMARVWTWVQSRMPSLVGGCRPVDVLPLLAAADWEIRHHSKLVRLGVTSEVLVARRAVR